MGAYIGNRARMHQGRITAGGVIIAAACCAFASQALARLQVAPQSIQAIEALESGPMDPSDPTSQLAAADGYWLMIKPLTRGRHILVIGANYGASAAAYGGMNQNFEYVLDVGGSILLGGVKRKGVEGVKRT